MRKLLFILFAVISINCFSQGGTQVIPNDKSTVLTTKVKTAINTVDSIAGDSVAVNEVKDTVSDVLDKKNESGMTWWEFIKTYWYLILYAFYKLAQIYYRHTPQKKSYWWLMLDITLIKAIFGFFPNKAKNGDKYTV